MLSRPDESSPRVHAIVDSFSEPGAGRVLRATIGLPEVGMTVILLSMCQDEHGPVCHGVAPPGAVGVEHAHDRWSLTPPLDQEVEQPQVSMQ